MSSDLAVTDLQPSHVRHKGCSRYRVRAKTSYVDETLFGHSNGLQRSVAEFEPPWGSTSQTGSQQPLLWSPSSQIRPSANGKIGPVPTPSKCGGTPIKKNKYRLKCRMPSYCDESLFGSKQEDPGWEAPWTAEEDKIKIRPLLWTPSVHKISSNEFCSEFSPAKGNPVKPPYAVTKESSTDFITEYRDKADYWKRPNSDSDSVNDTPIRERSQSLTRMHNSKKRIVKADSTYTARNTEQLQYRPISAFTLPSGPQHYNRWRPGSMSDSVSSNQPKTTSSVTINPPWKY
ncbi:RBPJ-interacting and tubulin-associated protein 1-like isoform X1 [Carcharodon carcharias]|uniref:RBPJ-interacting and tubulin-associated protein 1-like isoform X1 n=1 Tax=Carcharodon carcharias TaxID=13397 RepID=UPI001B7EC122|nr:RBPJ-interacting and tubulin-associated protein 1-like isoform X1 [Carcharodon carcharias]XP_041058256.1 RBPJ-interacting and tubulin-associated protein 1-like isoform X1 [Carcharodon carcharias]